MSGELTMQDVVRAVKDLKRLGWIPDEMAGFKKPDDREKVQFT
jgi:hypothetical protein